MSEKRFTWNNHTIAIEDTQTKKHYYTDITCIDELVELLNELSERNDRQAKQLDNLYNLIEKEDWKTLKNIIQDFKECEEQLQREWKTYE